MVTNIVGKPATFVQIHTPLWLFLFCYFIFSLFSFSHYGITADEARRQEMGDLMFRRTFLHEKVRTQEFADHYPFYDMIMRVLNPLRSYETGHLINMLFSAVLFIAGYILLYSRFKKPLVSLMGPVFFVLTPVVFGHIPANPKDIPFAWGYLLAIALFYVLNLKTYPIWVKGIVLGLVVGFTHSMRFIGFNLYPVYVVFFVVLNLKKAPLPQIIKRLFLELCLMLIVSLGFMVATWPFAADNFPRSLISIAKSSADFAEWDRVILYFGQDVGKTTRPLSFVPVWLWLATPLFVMAGSALGFATQLYRAVTKKRVDTLFLLLSFVFLANFAMYLVVNPVLYNGPRLFLYFFPILALLAALFYGDILSRLHGRALIAGLIVLTLIVLPEVITTIKMYPYHYIYFNPIARKIYQVEKMFETDYWGATYKEASATALKLAGDAQIASPVLCACNNISAAKYYIQGQGRHVRNTQDANYVLCDVERVQKRNYPYQTVGTVERDGILLNTIMFNARPGEDTR